MEYIIGAAVFLVIFVIGGLYMQKKSEKKRALKIKESFGLVPELEYTYEKYESIGYYYRERLEKDPENNEHCNIDNITWHDLDMDKVYMTLNATQSSIGEEYLYYLLRTPELKDDKLTEREKLINFFTKKAEKRVKLQTELSKAGRLDKVSVYEYLGRLEQLDDESNFKHFMCIFLLVAAVASLFIIPVVGIISLLGVFFYNIISYFKRKGQIENYYAVVAYILRTLDVTNNICNIEDEVLSPYISVLKEQHKQFKSITRGAGLIVSKKSSGDILEVALDYLRMATHIDLIRFNVMLKKLKSRKDDFDKIYEVIGLLDSMAAVASFRRLMGAWCIPELIRENKGAGSSLSGISATNIYHPMIISPVKNDFTESGNVLLTGSNASGKSTFIKTVAINSILAQTINTVLADSYKGTFFKCMTSMALADNLSDGESYYIVEIKSLKRICDSLRDDVPLLIFIDEVLRGTNTLERIAASSQILSYVGKRNCMLFAATHDIELTYILEKEFYMYHFEEKVEDNGVTFDYKLKSGRAVTRNAILLLKMLKFDSEITDKAEEAADKFLKTGDWGNA